MVMVTPLARFVTIFPVKFAAGGHDAPPEPVQLMSEKFMLALSVGGFDVQVWPKDTTPIKSSIAAKRSFIFIKTFSSRYQDNRRTKFTKNLKDIVSFAESSLSETNIDDRNY